MVQHRKSTPLPTGQTDLAQLEGLGGVRLGKYSDAPCPFCKTLQDTGSIDWQAGSILESSRPMQNLFNPRAPICWRSHYPIDCPSADPIPSRASNETEASCCSPATRQAAPHIVNFAVAGAIFEHGPPPSGPGCIAGRVASSSMDPSDRQILLLRCLPSSTSQNNISVFILGAAVRNVNCTIAA